MKPLLDQFTAVACTDSSSTGLDHIFHVFLGSDTAGSFDAHFRTDSLSHQSDIFLGGSAFGETGGSLDKISTGLLGKKAYSDFLFIGEKASFDDDLQNEISA